MGTVRHENGVDARLFASLVHEEHVIQARRAHRHHSTHADAADGTRAEQLAKGPGIGRSNLADDGEDLCHKGDGPSSVNVRERCEDEWRDAA
jgi:hypothetical protein